MFWWTVFTDALKKSSILNLFFSLWTEEKTKTQIPFSEVFLEYSDLVVLLGHMNISLHEIQKQERNKKMQIHGSSFFHSCLWWILWEIPEKKKSGFKKQNSFWNFSVWCSYSLPLVMNSFLAYISFRVCFLKKITFVEIRTCFKHKAANNYFPPRNRGFFMLKYFLSY